MKDEEIAGGKGYLALIGIGPGDLGQMTIAAQMALQNVQIVLGYQVYIDLVQALLRPNQEVMASPIGDELNRAKQAIELATAGRRVALISSGDIGIYAMASPVFELLRQHQWQGQGPEVQVYPGISAVQATAAKLGAPLGHDFCTISLSDLLTPWPVIERRVQAAAWGDFVIAFYNPRSHKRDWQLPRALEILRAYRQAETPVAIARHITRPEEQIQLTTLAQLDPAHVDMFTLVLIGNSQSYVLANHLVTPRGYENKVERMGAEEQGSREQGSAPLPPNDVYPIALIGMANTLAIVVGGGPVGERKVQGLLTAGAQIRLISPTATPQLQDWAAAGQIEWVSRPYEPGDVAGASLVFAATNERAINAQVAREAKAAGRWCNIADQPDEGNFHVPAVHRQPGLVVAVSTTGQSPVRAKQVRDQLAGWLSQANGE